MVESSRPSRRVDLLVPHLPLAVFSGLLLLAASVAPLESLPMVPCWFKRITGWPCLFFGMTRAFSAMGHGRLGEGIEESPAGALLYAATVLTFLLNAFALLARRRVKLSLPRWLTGKALAWSAAAALLANWIYRIGSGRL